jgi:hypothetical protein
MSLELSVRLPLLSTRSICLGIALLNPRDQRQALFNRRRSQGEDDCQ